MLRNYATFVGKSVEVMQIFVGKSVDVVRIFVGKSVYLRKK